MSLKDIRVAFSEDAAIYIKENILSLTKDTRDMILSCLEQTRKKSITRSTQLSRRKECSSCFKKESDYNASHLIQ